MADPVSRDGDQFPLGRPPGQVRIADEPASGRATRPFGLRYLVEFPPDAVDDIDSPELTYDPFYQLTVVHEDEVLIPTCRRRSGKTKTETQRDDKNAPDDDEDVG